MLSSKIQYLFEELTDQFGSFMIQLCKESGGYIKQVQGALVVASRINPRDLSKPDEINSFLIFRSLSVSLWLCHPDLADTLTALQLYWRSKCLPLSNY